MITASFILDAAERPRVLLADDHPAMHALTAAALAGECLVVGSVGELLAAAERLRAALENLSALGTQVLRSCCRTVLKSWTRIFMPATGLEVAGAHSR